MTAARHRCPPASAAGVYDATRQWIAARYDGHPDVLAVYEYGTVKDPGISDIDLFMVVSDAPRPGLTDRLAPTECPEACRALLDRATIKIAADVHFRDIRLLGNFRKRLICGDDIVFNHLTAHDAHLAEIASVMDFLPERVLSMVVLSESPVPDDEELLGMLNSLRYSVAAAHRVMGRADAAAAAFSDALQDLRGGWYETGAVERRHRLSQLVDQARAVGRQAIVALGRFLSGAGCYAPPSSPAGTFYFSPTQGLRLVSLSEFETIAPSALVERPSDDCRVMAAPAIWAAHLNRYARLEGIISRRIAGNLSCPDGDRGAVRTDLADLLDRKMRLCNDMAAFFRANGLPRGRLYRFAHIRRVTPPTTNHRPTTGAS